MCPGPETQVCSDPCHLDEIDSESSDDNEIMPQQPKPLKIKPEGHVKCMRRTATLEEIILDQSFITELQNGNKMVLDFLS